VQRAVDEAQQQMRAQGGVAGEQQRRGAGKRQHQAEDQQPDR
jgi:hypothetical protein